MKSKKLLSALLLSCFAFAGCNGEEPAPEGEQETPVVTSDLKELKNVVDRDSIATFKANTNAGQADGIARFVDLTSPYLVGTDNNFKLAPSLTYEDNEGFTVIHSSKVDALTNGWNIELKEGATEVDASKYSFNSKTCELKLHTSLAGKTLTAVVKPNVNEEQGITAEKANTFVTRLTFKAVEGYNVYEAKELYYLDNRPDGVDTKFGSPNDDSEFDPKINEFKVAKGLDKNYHPASVILQDDISVTVADLPEKFFYKESELSGSWTQYKGSMKDYTFLIERFGEENASLEGNYFQLDISQVPLAYRQTGRDELMGEGSHVGHHAFFAIGGGHFTINNLNFTGNSGNYVNEGDQKNAGGLMLIKTGCSTTGVDVNNILARKNFITIMTEKPDEGLTPSPIVLTKSKFTDNYNSFLYNWGGEMSATECYFHGCGGPIIIQDHTSCGDTGPWESPAGDVAYGFAPKTAFTDCVLDNYVRGSEAWFKQFGADGLAQTVIKPLSDVFVQDGAAVGCPQSFISTKTETKDGNGNVISTTYTPNVFSKEGVGAENSYFNFISLNKSSEAQGMTAYPVCGEVKITETGKSTVFNYLKADNLQNYVTHIALRKLNEGGAPIFETKTGSAAIINQAEPTLESLLSQDQVKEGMKTIYETAVKVLGVKTILDAMNLTPEAKVREIVRGDDYLVKFAIEFIVRGQVAAVVGEQIAAGMSDEQILIAGMDAAAGGSGQGTIVSDYATARAMLLQGNAETFAQLRQITMVANILETGKILTEELGLINIVDYFKGVSTSLEPTVEEAVSHFFGTKYEIVDTVLTPTDATKDNDNYISIAQIANKFYADGTSLTDASTIAATIGEGNTKANFFNAENKYTAIYYNGMMLVFGLGNVDPTLLA